MSSMKTFRENTTTTAFKIIEKTHYHAWIHVVFTHIGERDALIRMEDVFMCLSQSPGHDTYEMVVECGEWRALLIPEKNTFQYTKEQHERCETILGRGTVETRLVKDGAYLQFVSPIEQSFWDAWIEANHFPGSFNLTPQYPVGKYYVDFAHRETKTAIELDGFASHSSTEDIANDRKRQREIEAMGWRVIRFGGKEIHHDVNGCVKEAWRFISERDREKGIRP